MVSEILPEDRSHDSSRCLPIRPLRARDRPRCPGKATSFRSSNGSRLRNQVITLAVVLAVLAACLLPHFAVRAGRNLSMVGRYKRQHVRRDRELGRRHRPRHGGRCVVERRFLYARTNCQCGDDHWRTPFRFRKYQRRHLRGHQHPDPLRHLRHRDTTEQRIRRRKRRHRQVRHWRRSDLAEQFRQHVYGWRSDH